MKHGSVQKVIRFLSLIRIIITIVLFSLALHEETQHGVSFLFNEIDSIPVIQMYERRNHHLIDAYDNRPSVGMVASPNLYYLYFKAKQ